MWKIYGHVAREYVTSCHTLNSHYFNIGPHQTWATATEPWPMIYTSDCTNSFNYVVTNIGPGVIEQDLYSAKMTGGFIWDLLEDFLAAWKLSTWMGDKWPMLLELECRLLWRKQWHRCIKYHQINKSCDRCVTWITATSKSGENGKRTFSRNYANCCKITKTI